MDLVKLVVLGAPCVGKSSIVKQFVWNEFSDEYVSTESKRTYYPSVIINDHLYELKIVDVPVIPYFPVNSLYEWNDFRFYGLRSATAYILVYDMTSFDTFQYIRAIREQIYESRNMQNVPLIVVGNKQDLCRLPRSSVGHPTGPATTTSMLASGNQGVSNTALLGGSYGGVGSISIIPTSGGGVGLSSARGANEESRKNEVRREVINIVKKQWKCTYIECSAKYNWHIVALFKEIMKNVDYIEYGPKNTSNSVNIRRLDKSKCAIL